MAEQSRLRTVPVTLSTAQAFVDRVHRHHRATRAHKLSVGVLDDGDVLRGVAVLEYAKARMLSRQVVEVTRCATDGCENAPSALYGASCRIAHAHGFEFAITYTLAEESGVSLRAAGWRPVAVTRGGSWDRDGRPRIDRAPTGPKVRWECRHGPSPSIGGHLVGVAATRSVAETEVRQALAVVGHSTERTDT